MKYLSTTQSDWDEFNQSVSNAMGITYAPSPAPEPILVERYVPPAWTGIPPWNKGLTKDNPGQYADAFARSTAPLNREPWNRGKTGCQVPWNKDKANPYDTETVQRMRSQGHHYTITAPDGTVYQVDGLNGFCRDHNLDRGAMRRVFLGEKSNHKGWTVIKQARSE